MHKLWIFGDSYSASHKWCIHSYSDGDENISDPSQHKYIIKKYLKENKIPKHFEDVLGEHFGLEVGRKYNYAVGGFDNYSILETIGKNIHKIKEDDYVVIGWTSLLRFRLLNDAGNWSIVHPAGIDLIGGFDDKPQSFLNTMTRIMSLRYKNKDGYEQGPKSKLHKEIKSFANIVNKGLPKNTIHWTPFGDGLDTKENLFWIPQMQINQIRNETNGEIDDGHYSETGHIQIGKKMIEWFKNPKLIYPYLQKI